MRMTVRVIMMAAVLVMMMGRRMDGLRRSAFGGQVFFRIRAERRDAMLRAEEILAAVVRNGAGRPGWIDLHAAHRSVNRVVPARPSPSPPNRFESIALL